MPDPKTTQAALDMVPRPSWDGNVFGNPLFAELARKNTI